MKIILLNIRGTVASAIKLDGLKRYSQKYDINIALIQETHVCKKSQGGK